MNRDEGQAWKIGELALLTGLTVRTLHHYDEIGLLRPSRRTPAGHRLYDAGDVQRLYQVVRLRELGLPLTAINAVLDSAPDPSALLCEHLAHLDRRLEAIRTLRRRVAAVVAGTRTAGRPTAADLLDLIREVITVDETVNTYFGATHQPSMDPTFYRSPAEAVAAPPETLAYVAAFDRSAEQPDALAVINVDPSSQRYGQVVGWADLPTHGDELHHFGWNACSSALMHAGHDMGAEGLQRRYLLLPGLRSSNVHVYDTQPDPASPRLVKTITADELASKAGYSRPHTLHCGPDGIFLSCLGGANGNDGPGGIALLDHNNFDVLRAWETDRGPQYLAYDAWWHLTQNTLVSSEWGTPSMIENGIVPELLLNNKYGHRLHFWDLAKGVHQQALDLGAEHQMALELRPAHDPAALWGFLGGVVSTADLSASVWRWYRDGDAWAADKVISIPAQPADPADLPPALQPFGAVPPLVTDINLAVDDKMLYVSCWGTGELKQYDVSEPATPREVGSVRLGGITARAAHPARPEQRLAGGPQMIEVSRDGRRVYATNSLYGAWDDQFYPDGVGAWMAKVDTDPVAGGLTVDDRFFLHGDDFRGRRVHQVRLQGGDASSDSYCYRS
jgi:methanethiol oxidase